MNDNPLRIHGNASENRKEVFCGGEGGVVGVETRRRKFRSRKSAIFCTMHCERKRQHDRIIFIELNRTQTVNSKRSKPDWAAAIDRQLADAEAQLTINGQPASPAYLFVTNRAFMQALDAPECGEIGAAFGYKIPEFRKGRGLGLC